MDKPAGVSSADTVEKAKRALTARKAGHAGTLDIPATGILAIAFGEATKTIPFVTAANKTYRFTVRFGASTDTDDAEGSVTDTSKSRPDNDEIRQALDQFRGEILQVPPNFSAVKVSGERAHELSRRGEEPVLKARPLKVERIELLQRLDRDCAEFELVCGKGGYVRSFARDLGQTLGCLGHALKLRRTQSGPFKEEDCLSLRDFDDLAMRSEGAASLLPLEIGLAGIPELRCTIEGASRLRNGSPGEVFGGQASYGQTAWASLSGKAVAIGTFRAGELHPHRVFKRPAGGKAP